MTQHTGIALTLATLGALATTATADIVGVEFVEYDLTTTDFGGAVVSVKVQDLYAVADAADDVVLNAYSMHVTAAAQVSYYQSYTGTGWAPINLGGPFDTDALRQADSFVTIGGVSQLTARPEQTVGAGAGSTLDPDFGDPNAAYPSEMAGWYNSSPPSLNGSVGEMDWLTTGSYGVFIGRFSYAGDFTLEDCQFSFTWNQGIGTDPSQARFSAVPAPGAIALLGLAGLAGRRRRG